MTEWKSMHTAPLNPYGEFNGPMIIVWNAADGLPWPVTWGDGGPDGKGCWHIADAESFIFPEDAVAWMPMPDAPIMEGTAGND